jgi:type I restriction enzyme S subunit
MRDSWTEFTIGEIAAIVPGKYLPKNEYVEEGDYFVYGSNSIMGKYSKFLIEPPHIVMAAIGAYAGAVRYSPVPSWVNNNAFALLVKPAVLPGYFYLWLDSQLDLSTVVVGTGQPYVQRPSLRATKVALPPLSDQKRIVDVIASVDDYTTALQKQAAAARNARNAVLQKLLTAGGEDWIKTTVGEIASLGNGGTWGADEAGDGLVAASCLRGTDLADLIDGQQPTAPVRWLKESELTKARCMENMILIETSGSKCGRSVLLTKKMLDVFERPVVFSNFCRTLRIDLDKLMNKYAELWFSHAYATGLIPSYRATSAMPNLDIKSLLRIEKMLLPPFSEQKRIVETVSAMDDAIRLTEQAVTDAQRLRLALLSDLLSGDHEIPESYDRLLGVA